MSKQWNLYTKPNQSGFGELWTGENVPMPGRWRTPNSTGTEAPTLGPLPDL